MALINRPCPVCNNTEASIFYNCKDFTVTAEIFPIVICKVCSMVYTNPIPDEASIGKYYKTDNYISHSDTKTGLINKVYQLVRSFTLKKKYQLIKNLNGGKNGKLLDIGCGTGYFLSHCKNKGWKVSGTEPDRDANALARTNSGQDIPYTIEELKKETSFDIITLWHVLEHIHEVNNTLSRIYQLLEARGKLIIAVPNYESLDALTYKENWAAFDVPRHLYHFSKNSLENLLHNHNFKLTKILPMKFDSFYVSMMTEKNLKKSGLIPYISGFFNGLRSNMARPKNYSSQIYIFEKSDNTYLK